MVVNFGKFKKNSKILSKITTPTNLRMREFNPSSKIVKNMFGYSKDKIDNFLLKQRRQ